MRGLEVDCGLMIEDQVYFVVGAGGVSRAIMTVLASKKPKRIYLANRTFSKAEEICTHLNSHFGDICVPLPLDGELKSYIDQSTVLINATTVSYTHLDVYKRQVLSSGEPAVVQILCCVR